MGFIHTVRVRIRLGFMRVRNAKQHIRFYRELYLVTTGQLMIALGAVKHPNHGKTEGGFNMLTKSINLFTFDELDSAVKEKVINRHRDIDVEGEWYGFIYEQWIDKLNKLGYKEAKIHFRGFWSQGDGASFDAKPDLRVLRLKKGMKFRPIDHLIRNESLYGKIEGHSSHYCHELTRRFEIIDQMVDISKQQSALITELEALIEKERVLLCQQIYDQLREEYGYFTSDDYVSETLREANFLFQSNGDSEPRTIN